MRRWMDERKSREGRPLMPLYTAVDQGQSFLAILSKHLAAGISCSLAERVDSIGTNKIIAHRGYADYTSSMEPSDD